jgi:hypothetical protein
MHDGHGVRTKELLRLKSGASLWLVPSDAPGVKVAAPFAARTARLACLGFTAGEADALSSLHTRDFM